MRRFLSPMMASAILIAGFALAAGEIIRPDGIRPFLLVGAALMIGAAGWWLAARIRAKPVKVVSLVMNTSSEFGSWPSVQSNSAGEGSLKWFLQSQVSDHRGWANGKRFSEPLQNALLPTRQLGRCRPRWHPTFLRGVHR